MVDEMGVNSTRNVLAFIAAISLVIVKCNASNCLLASSCAELLLQGHTQSGIYTIHPRGWYSVYPFRVYCDMDTEGGGWTLIQRRVQLTPYENFLRNWRDYKQGFGDLNREFWLGNEYLYILTNQDRVTLRVDMEHYDGNTNHAQYKHFQVSDERDSYRLSISGYQGDAVDGFTPSHDQAFTTFDRNDVHNCSPPIKGGWWYAKCVGTNLNGMYVGSHNSTIADRINWRFELIHHFRFKTVQMKIRPTNFAPNSHIHFE